jgi:hypothetical protein
MTRSPAAKAKPAAKAPRTPARTPLPRTPLPRTPLPRTPARPLARRAAAAHPPAAPRREQAERRMLLAREGAALRRVVGAGARVASIAARVRFAGIVRRQLRGAEPCLKRILWAVGRGKKEPRMALLRGGGAEPAPAVVFGRALGAGAYGEAFLNTGARGAGRLLRFAAKVAPASQAEEVAVLEKMSALAEAGLCPNMPITFASLRCRARCREPGCPDVAREGAYQTVVAELADGDLFKLFAARLTRAEYESVLMQCLLALRAFHGLGLEHNDAHFGNFLFHRVPAGGYWRYDVPAVPGLSARTPLFVPNRGILAVLWDPGFAKPLHAYDSLEGATDYFKVMNAFARMGEVKGEGGKLLKAPAKEDAAEMNLGGLLAELYAAMEARDRGARGGDGGEALLGHRLLEVVLRGIREGRWLKSIRVGARRRLPVRDLRRGRGEAGKVRTPGGRTLERTRTLAPSPLPARFRLLNAKPFRLEPRASPSASPPRRAPSDSPPRRAPSASPPRAAAASPPPANITRRRRPRARTPASSSGTLSSLERDIRNLSL